MSPTYQPLLCVGAELWYDRVVIHTYMGNAYVCMFVCIGHVTNFYQPVCVGVEFWDDRVVSADDLEGSDGGDGQRVTHCRRTVWIHGASFSGIMEPSVADP